MSSPSVFTTDIQCTGTIYAQQFVGASFSAIDLTTSVSGVLPVANGGTGDATLTSHAVLLGAGTSTVGFATTGTAGQVLVDQGAGADPLMKPISGDATLTAAGLVTIAGLKGYVNGLPLSYTSATTITVGLGTARDKANAATMTLAAAGVISTATLGAINGIDRKTLTGTCATNSGNGTVTGTNTLFLTEFGTRTGSGTIAGASTTITGTSSKFLSEFAVGDLIGTNALGYSRITAIASDTSLTIVSAIPGGNPSGNAPVCIEHAHFQANAQTVRRIGTITSNTSMALAVNSSATESGVTGYAGALPSVQCFLMAWLGSGGTGTGVYLSTQRTTPFGLTGYTTSVRHIGSVLWDGSAFVAFDQRGAGVERIYQYEVPNSTAGLLVANGVTNVAWTALDCSGVAPPTAGVLALDVTVQTGGTASMLGYVRCRGTGSATVARANQINVGMLNSIAGSVLYQACDGAQAIDYATSNASAGNALYLTVCGYQESL
jgi:hypothetical protein